MRGATIIGTGIALPDKVITNDDLAARMDTSDDWIVTRTGIKERRVGGTTTGLAVEAARNAIADAGCDPSSIEMVLLATTSPDRSCPASAVGVTLELGLTCGALDLNAACAGWVYGLVIAEGLAAQGINRILLIGAETVSRLTDWDDRGTAILFADGAGAAVLDAVDGPGQLLAFDLCSDGEAEKYLYAEVGGTFVMNGKEVFRNAVSLTTESSIRSLEKAGVTADGVDLVVAHQANIRIIDACAKRLDIPMDKWVTIIDWTGNTSAASVPLALHQARLDGRVEPGSTILLAGFGAGMTVATAVIRWAG